MGKDYAAAYAVFASWMVFLFGTKLFSYSINSYVWIVLLMPPTLMLDV